MRRRPDGFIRLMIGLYSHARYDDVLVVVPKQNVKHKPRLILIVSVSEFVCMRIYAYLYSMEHIMRPRIERPTYQMYIC